MTLRAIVVWSAILIGAIANGYVRQAWIIPRTGDTLGHVISTISLSLIVACLAWLTIGWIGPTTKQESLWLGALWLLLTLAFEFIAGHFLFGQPWSRLLADYNVAKGRIWVLVLITTTMSPFVAARARGLFNERYCPH